MVQNDYNTPVYRRSRKAYCIFCMLEYFVSLLITDVYLFKMLSYIGLDDGTIGVLASLGTGACIFQLMSLGFLRVIKRVKVWVVICSAISQITFVMLYLLVFVPMSIAFKTAVAVIGLLMGFFLQNAVGSLLFQWANSYVDPHKRATYSAEKEIMSLAGGMIFTFSVGLMMDYFEDSGNLKYAFLVILIIGCLVAAGSVICLMNIDDKTTEEQPEQMPPVRNIVRELNRSRAFRQLIVLNIFWSAAQCLTMGFLGSYKSRELMLSVSAVQLINIAANLIRVFISKPIGRFADRTSYARCIELCLYVVAVSFACVVLSTPSARWLIVAFVILNSIGQAGIGQNMTNIVYDFVPAEQLVPALSMKNFISGACGFLVSLVGGAILTDIQNGGNQLFGIRVYGQQVLGLLSGMLTVMAALYAHFIIRTPEKKAPAKG